MIDKSAFVRMTHESIDPRWGRMQRAGFVSVCALVELEVLFSAQSNANYDAICAELRGLYSWVFEPDNAPARAREVQEALVRVGKHRGPGPMDLLIAATAEHHGLTVLHYDADYETIAEITGQPTEWIGPRGSI